MASDSEDSSNGGGPTATGSHTTRNSQQGRQPLGTTNANANSNANQNKAYADGDADAEDLFLHALGVAPNKAKRSVEEAEQLTVNVKKEERAKLKEDNQKAYDSHRKRVTSTIAEGEKKFAMMAPKQGMEELKSVYDVAAIIETYHRECADEDTVGVFTVVTPLKKTEKGDVVIASKKFLKKDLLKQYVSLTLDQVQLHCKLLYTYGKDYEVENLRWMADKLIKSCDKDLEKKLQEKTKLLPQWQHACRPILFKIMIDLVLLTNEEGIHAITNFVPQLKLKDQAGENVNDVTSLLRGAITFLNSNKAFPADMMEVAHNIMRECSTDAFVSEIDNVYFNHRSGVKPISLNDFLSRCEASYFFLCNISGYTPIVLCQPANWTERFNGLLEPTTRNQQADSMPTTSTLAVVQVRKIPVKSVEALRTGRMIPNAPRIPNMAMEGVAKTRTLALGPTTPR